MCKGKDGNELFFNTKRPKPHKGQCREVSDRLFHSNSLKMLIHQKYKLIVQWPTTLMEMIKQVINKDNLAMRYMDLNNEVVVGKEFWKIIDRRVHMRKS